MIPVGTTAKGAQDVPSSLDATGWWRDGSKPGQPGNAVIVGHTASKGDGVFDELGDLEKGDKITVSSGKKKLTYTVTKEQVLEVSKFATVADEIYRRTGPSGIVLMTCGDWNGTRFETTVIITAKLKLKAGAGTWSRPTPESERHAASSGTSSPTMTSSWASGSTTGGRSSSPTARLAKSAAS